MSSYTSTISNLKRKMEERVTIENKLNDLYDKLTDLNTQSTVFLEAQQILSSVSDTNTANVLNYISGVINNTLSKIFPYDVRRIQLDSKLHSGKHPHINLHLLTEDGDERDIVLQSGTGLRQTVSFLFVLSLIEVRKGRRIVIMDEILSGLHPEAKAIIADIMRIFASEGFQFIMIEYGMNRLGKLYLVEKPKKVASVTAMTTDTYNNEVFIFNRPVEDIDKSIKEEYEGDLYS